MPSAEDSSNPSIGSIDYRSIALPGESSSNPTETPLVEFSVAQRERIKYLWGDVAAEELLNIFAERDPQLLAEALFSLGCRLENDNRLDLATHLFNCVSTLLPQGAHPLRDRCRIRLDAIQGKGAAMPRIEFLARRLAEQASDPSAILAMGAAGMTARVMRLAILGRLSASPAATLLRGTLLRAVAGGGAFAAETVAFTATGRLANSALGREQDWTLRGLWREYAGGALGLLGIKAMGGIGASAAQRWLQNSGNLSALLRGIATHGGTVAGIHLGHRLEEHFGFRESCDNSTAVTDLLGSWANLYLGGRLMHATLGETFQSRERAMDAATGALERHSPMAAQAPSLQNHIRGNLSVSNLRRGLRAFGRSLLLAPLQLIMGNIGEGFAPSRLPNQSPGAREALMHPTALRIRQRLNQQWIEWSQENGVPEDTQLRLAPFLTYYSRCAIEILGRETPAALPFVEEIYSSSQELWKNQEGQETRTEDRNLLIRFLSTQGARRHSLSRSGAHTLPNLDPKPLAPEILRQISHGLRTNLVDFAGGTADNSPSSLVSTCLTMLEAYAGQLHSFYGGRLPLPLEQIPFEPGLFEIACRSFPQTQNTPRAKELLADFFSDFLGAPEARAIRNGPTPNEPITDLSRAPSPIRTPPTVTPAEGINAPQFLESLGFSRGTLEALQIVSSPDAALQWGLRGLDGHKRTPRDFLELLSLVTYINSTRSEGIDAFEFLRLQMGEELATWIPDEQGNIPLRYPKELSDLAYEDLGVQALLSRRRSMTQGARDLDIAEEWGVVTNTAAGYRRGVDHRMRWKTLQGLARSLGSTPEQQREMEQFLTFLRHRPYVEATIPIFDSRGHALAPLPPYPSRYRIVLLPQGKEWRSLDTSRRIAFDREPFASAMDGATTLALQLMLKRRAEFQFGDGEFVRLPQGQRSLSEMDQMLASYQERHEAFVQEMRRQVSAPQPIAPNRIEEIRIFYRDFYRMFEAFYLHARPMGRLGAQRHAFDFEIVPSSLNHLRGVRFMTIDGRLKAFAVATDLIDTGSGHPSNLLRQVFQLRLLRAYLEERRLLPATQASPQSLRHALHLFMTTQGMEPPRAEAFSLWENLEAKTLNWNPILVDPIAGAAYHRVMKGRGERGAYSRREWRWKDGLEPFIVRESLQSIRDELTEVLELYLHNTPHPLLEFRRDALEEALASRVSEGESREFLREAVLSFLRSTGLATTEMQGPPHLSVEGLADAVFGRYLDEYNRLNPWAQRADLIEDSVLLQNLLDYSLQRHPHFSSEREQLIETLRSLISNYNLRKPMLRLRGLERHDEEASEIFHNQALQRALIGEWEAYTRAYPNAPQEAPLQLVLACHGLLQGKLVSGEPLARAELAMTLREAIQALDNIGAKPHAIAEEHSLRFLDRWTLGLRRRLRQLESLEGPAQDYVLSGQFQSGFTPPASFAEDIRQIFRSSVRDRYLTPRPGSLEDTVLAQVGERFGPYQTIRQEVVRGYRVVFRQLIEGFRAEYAGLAATFDALVSGSDFHGETALESLAQTQGHEGPLALIEHVEALESLIQLLPGAPERLLSDRLLEETNTAQITEKYSTPPQPLNPSSVQDQAEPLITRPELVSPSPIAPVPTAESTPPASEEFVDFIEIKREAEALGTEDLDRALHSFLSKKRWNGSFSRDFDGIYRSFEARLHQLGPSELTLEQDGNFQRVKEEFAAEWRGLYIKHRLTLSNAPFLPTDHPLAEAMQRIDQDFPELHIFTLKENLGPAPKDETASHLPFPMPGFRARLNLVSQSNNRSVSRIQQQMALADRRLRILTSLGGDSTHLGARELSSFLQEYKSIQKIAEPAIREYYGLRRMVASLPEIRNEPLAEDILPEGLEGLRISRLDEEGVLRRALQRIVRLPPKDSAVVRIKNEILSLLRTHAGTPNIPVPNLKDFDTVASDYISEWENRLLGVYWQVRGKISPSGDPLPENWKLVMQAAEECLRSFWQLSLPNRFHSFAVSPDQLLSARLIQFRDADKEIIRPLSEEEYQQALLAYNNNRRIQIRNLQIEPTEVICLGSTPRSYTNACFGLFILGLRGMTLDYLQVDSKTKSFHFLYQHLVQLGVPTAMHTQLFRRELRQFIQDTLKNNVNPRIDPMDYLEAIPEISTSPIHGSIHETEYRVIESSAISRIVNNSRIKDLSTIRTSPQWIIQQSFRLLTYGKSCNFPWAIAIPKMPRNPEDRSQLIHLLAWYHMLREEFLKERNRGEGLIEEEMNFVNKILSYQELTPQAMARLPAGNTPEFGSEPRTAFPQPIYRNILRILGTLPQNHPIRSAFQARLADIPSYANPEYRYFTVLRFYHRHREEILGALTEIP